MATQLVRGGGSLDIPTAEETAAAVDTRLAAFIAQQKEIADARDREHARGIKLIRRDTVLQPAASTRFTNLDWIGPTLGYIWAVTLLSATLASAGTMQAYITSDTSTSTVAANSRRLVANGASGTSQVFNFSKGQCPLFPDEGLFLSAAQNITSYLLVAWEVPAEMVWKLL